MAQVEFLLSNNFLRRECARFKRLEKGAHSITQPLRIICIRYRSGDADVLMRFPTNLTEDSCRIVDDACNDRNLAL